MAQNYPNIPSTDSLQNSRQKILDRDDAVASCFSGTTFPTAGVQAGILCLRTDEQKLYQLKSTGPDVWVVIADLSKSYLSKEEAQALFAAIGHNHDTAYQAKDADLTAVAGLTATGLIERTGDGQAQAVPVTPAGKALLDDANAAAQRTTLGLSDAATTPVADIQAGVDQSGRVAKTGDTMSGELVAPSLKSQGTAGATGFKIADATDLAALFNKGYQPHLCRLQQFGDDAGLTASRRRDLQGGAQFKADDVARWRETELTETGQEDVPCLVLFQGSESVFVIGAQAFA